MSKLEIFLLGIVLFQFIIIGLFVYFIYNIKDDEELGERNDYL